MLEKNVEIMTPPSLNFSLRYCFGMLPKNHIIRCVYSFFSVTF